MYIGKILVMCVSIKNPAFDIIIAGFLNIKKLLFRFGCFFDGTSDFFLAGGLGVGEGFGFGGFGLEFLDTSGSVNQFLFAGKEGVTSATDFHIDLIFGGASNKRITTSAFDLAIFVIFRMNVFFHKICVNRQNIRL